MSKILYSAMLAFLLMGCQVRDQSDQNEHNNNEHNRVDHTDIDHTDIEASGTKANIFISEHGDGFAVSKPKTKESYLYSSSYNVPMDENDHPLEFPYDQFDFEMFSEYGQPYPFKTGTYTLGSTAEERLYDSCSKCVLYWPNTIKNGDYDGTFFAVGGTVTIEAIETGHLRLVFSNLEFERVSDEDFAPLSAADAAYFTENQLKLTMAEAVVDIDYFHNYDCNSHNCLDDDCSDWSEVGNYHCDYYL